MQRAADLVSCFYSALPDTFAMVDAVFIPSHFLRDHRSVAGLQDWPSARAREIWRKFKSQGHAGSLEEESCLSSIDIATSQIKRLSSEEWQTLRALERCSATRTRTDVDALSRMSGQPMDRVKFAIQKLNERGLTRNAGANQLILAAGLDLLAVKHFVDSRALAAFGKIIAKGKESDVYEVIDDEGQLYALKLFRLGRTSFRDVRRKRKERVGDLHTWITRNYSAARREFSALKKLEGITTNVPQAVAFNRHAVLLGELLGVRLSEKPPLDDPMDLLSQILSVVRVAWVNARIVNGDLSEYNVLTDGTKAWVIDWPQWARATEQNAQELLERDVKATLRIFARAYGVDIAEEAAVEFASGKRARLPIRRAQSSR